MKKELHLILLWSKARNKEKEILSDISKKFVIKDVFDISWAKKNFETNIKRFYGVKVDTAKGKIKETGLGSFLLCIIEDESPVYEWQTTSRGSEKVNQNIFTLKNLYRSWTGGGHKIHTTNSESETQHDLTLLLGKTPDDFLKESSEKWNGQIKKINQDLIGTNGWKSLEELFYVLNATTPYVVLRNFEILPNNFSSKEHGDIDLLVEDFENAKLIMNAKKVFKENYRVHCSCLIKSQSVLFDLRYLGDNYYDFFFENRLLENKVIEKCFYKPSDENYFYSLVYHAIIHKRKVADDYFFKCKKLYNQLFNENDLDNLSDYDCFDIYYQKLLSFMQKNNYKMTKPLDKSVFFDENVVNSYIQEHLLKKKFPLKNITPFNIALKPVSGFFNYVAFFGNEKVFLKCGGIADSVKREFFASSLLSEKNPTYFSKPYFFRYDLNEKIFISSFEKGETLENILKKDNHKYDFEKIAQHLKEITLILQNLKIIHRDIRPANLLVDEKNNVKLIDYQFMISKEAKILKKTREMKSVSHLITDLGSIYRFSKMHWDDAYSVVKILKEINQKTNSKLIKEIIKDISADIGKLSYKITSLRSKNYKIIGIPYIFEFIKIKEDVKRRYVLRLFGVKIFSKKILCKKGLF